MRGEGASQLHQRSPASHLSMAAGDNLTGGMINARGTNQLRRGVSRLRDDMRYQARCVGGEGLVRAVSHTS